VEGEAAQEVDEVEASAAVEMEDTSVCTSIPCLLMTNAVELHVVVVLMVVALLPSATTAADTEAMAGTTGTLVDDNALLVPVAP
jgi:hypothetical protein